MRALISLLESNEDWLMERVLHYAKLHGYAVYTSTLKEAWRLSISGLTKSIIRGIVAFPEVPEITAVEDFSQDPVAQFGVVEARRHRERGVPLGMFLGLMKYYRQTYLDLLSSREGLDREIADRDRMLINRLFDKIEIGFCTEWSGRSANDNLFDLQIKNRWMTNEKNKYLTIFESIPNPVIVLNPSHQIENMNVAAASLLKNGSIAGAQYYCPARDRQLEAGQAMESPQEDLDPACLCGRSLDELLPWLSGKIAAFQQNDLETHEFEENVSINGEKFIFRVKLSKNLDVSEKYEGIVVILEDITSLKAALDEVRTLRGIIPICASCKRIRDDHGYWQMVEKYVQDHSEAYFSHGICPDCLQRLYPEISKN